VESPRLTFPVWLVAAGAAAPPVYFIFSSAGGGGCFRFIALSAIVGLAQKCRVGVIAGARDRSAKSMTLQ
jgi:hypothetical protein